jgi:hypothetical protein
VGKKKEGKEMRRKFVSRWTQFQCGNKYTRFAVGTSKRREEKREAVVKSFFFSSLALCIQNKSSGSCCNYLRTPHTTVRGTAVAAELLQSEFNHKQEETRAKTVWILSFKKTSTTNRELRQTNEDVPNNG